MYINEPFWSRLKVRIFFFILHLLTVRKYFKYEFAFYREWKAMPLWTIRKFATNMFG